MDCYRRSESSPPTFAMSAFWKRSSIRAAASRISSLSDCFSALLRICQLYRSMLVVISIAGPPKDVAYASSTNLKQSTEHPYGVCLTMASFVSLFFCLLYQVARLMPRAFQGSESDTPLLRSWLICSEMLDPFASAAAVLDLALMRPPFAPRSACNLLNCSSLSVPVYLK